ncbi:uncharacterized protein IUM83_09044 [Phytophthora cinnamomi]|uniref:uncharacterized protein n=1 Tax=Phytophthora cinnamomi TaxID=4785 RepID=UPI00355A08F7|nr:hypothetical protein IUM83_09044 [Phytophthora cinnamomi]
MHLPLGGLSKDDVTDDRIMSEVQAILQRVKNDTLPDVDHLFSKKLGLDMPESDMSERVPKYFVQCNQLMEENGVVVCFEGEHGSKEKCKLLIESLSPYELKPDVKNAIRFQAPAALTDECKLYDLILAKALEQDRDFLRRKRCCGTPHVFPHLLYLVPLETPNWLLPPRLFG